jgi:hypothetical protein
VELGRRESALRTGSPPTYGLSEEALALVKNFQPFKHHHRKGKTADQPLIRLLHLSNTDKHRVLHGTFAYRARKPENFRFEPPGFVAIEKVKFGPPGGIIENGAKIADVKVRLVKRPPEGVPVHVKFRCAVHMAFAGGQHFIAQYSDLKPILACVREIVAAAKELPEVPSHRRDAGAE